jgi:hypothetical protein
MECITVALKLTDAIRQVLAAVKGATPVIITLATKNYLYLLLMIASR